MPEKRKAKLRELSHQIAHVRYKIEQAASSPNSTGATSTDVTSLHPSQHIVDLHNELADLTDSYLRLIDD